MKVRVRLYNYNSLWCDNPYIEIDMPAAPQQDMQIFLGDDLTEKLIYTAEPYFIKNKEGMPCVWDCTYVHDMMYDVEAGVWNVCLSTEPKFA